MPKCGYCWGELEGILKDGQIFFAARYGRYAGMRHDYRTCTAHPNHSGKRRELRDKIEVGDYDCGVMSDSITDNDVADTSPTIS